MIRDQFAPVLGLLLDCAVDACTSGGLTDPPERAFIATGDVAWDDCGCGGQVWARLVSIEPATTSLNGPVAAQPCGVLLWTVTVGVGVVRCAATIDDQGNPPTPEVLNTEAAGTTSDLTAILDAVQCCATDQLGVRRVRVLRWTPLGPMGGCAGGEWTITVTVDACGCDG